jgi:hypothetical protein
MPNDTFDQIGGQLDVISAAIARTSHLVAQGRVERSASHQQTDLLRGQLRDASRQLEKRDAALLQCRSDVERLEAEVADLRKKLSGIEDPDEAANLTLWMWDKPIAALAGMPNVIRMIRPMLNRTPDPTDAARVVSQKARAAEAEGRRIAVMPQNFGGDPNHDGSFNKYGSGIHRHPADALTDTSTPAEQRAFTPWIRHGVRAVADWTEAFVDAWDGPDPEAFHFDSEPGFSPARWAGTYDFSSNGGRYVDCFNAVMQDPRWETERLFTTGRTMAEEYELTGRPPFVPNINPYNRANDDWRTWIVQLLWNEFTFGMSFAAYAPILQRWPACLVGNYGEHRASGFSQSKYDSPVLYGEPEKERAELEAVRASAPAGGTVPIIPWIKLPHVGATGSYSVDAVRGIIELAVEFGVRQFIVWWDHAVLAIAENEAPFNALAEIVADDAAPVEPVVVSHTARSRDYMCTTTRF